MKKKCSACKAQGAKRKNAQGNKNKTNAKKTGAKKKRTKVSSKRGRAKVEKVMHEFGAGELHSGSKKGPVVKNKRQAVAIALSEARKSGKKSRTQ